MSIPGKSKRTRSVLVAGVTSVALVAAGCGSSAPSGLSRSALVSKVDALCKQHHDAVAAAASKVLAGGQLPTPAKFGRLAHETIIPQYGVQIDNLSALKPQAKLASPYRAWLTASRETLAKMQQNPAVIQSSANFRAVNQQGDALGFSSNCHVGPG